MTDNIIALNFNGVKVILDSNTKLKRLFSEDAAATESLHDTDGAAVYQVPTGQKFTVIFVESCSATTAGDRLISSTTVDSTTGETVLIQPLSALTNVVFISTEVAADAFITKVENNAAHTWLVWGIEQAA